MITVSYFNCLVPHWSFPDHVASMRCCFSAGTTLMTATYFQELFLNAEKLLAVHAHAYMEADTLGDAFQAEIGACCLRERSCFLYDYRPVENR